MDEYNDAMYWTKKQQQAIKDLISPVEDAIKQQQAMSGLSVDAVADAMKQQRDTQIEEVAVPSRKTCAFCGSDGFLGRANVCSSCSEKLMKDLLRTREWKNASKVISDGIDKRISNHESRKHR